MTRTGRPTPATTVLAVCVIGWVAVVSILAGDTADGQQHFDSDHPLFASLLMLYGLLTGAAMLWVFWEALRRLLFRTVRIALERATGRPSSWDGPTQPIRAVASVRQPVAAGRLDATFEAELRGLIAGATAMESSEEDDGPQW